MIGAVVFDVGERLVDESREYGTWADWLGVPRHVFSAVFARGQDYQETFQVFRPGFDLDKARQQRADDGKPEWFGDEDLTRTFDKLKEARAELSRIRHETAKGVFVKPSDITVNDYLDEYFVGATRGWRQSTKVSYRDAFRPARERLGNRKLQSITKPDIENLVHWMLTSGRKRGGKPGTASVPARCD